MNHTNLIARAGKSHRWVNSICTQNVDIITLLSRLKLAHSREWNYRENLRRPTNANWTQLVLARWRVEIGKLMLSIFHDSSINTRADDIRLVTACASRLHWKDDVELMMKVTRSTETSRSRSLTGDSCRGENFMRNCTWNVFFYAQLALIVNKNSHFTPNSIDQTNISRCIQSLRLLFIGLHAQKVLESWKKIDCQNVAVSLHQSCRARVMKMENFQTQFFSRSIARCLKLLMKAFEYLSHCEFVQCTQIVIEASQSSCNVIEKQSWCPCKAKADIRTLRTQPRREDFPTFPHTFRSLSCLFLGFMTKSTFSLCFLDVSSRLEHVNFFRSDIHDVHSTRHFATISLFRHENEEKLVAKNEILAVARRSSDKNILISITWTLFSLGMQLSISGEHRTEPPS